MDATGRPAFAQRRQHRFGNFELSSGLPIATARPLRHLQCPPLETFEVGEHQLRLDRLGIADRIDRTFDMDHIAIRETAQDVRDGVDLANVSEKLVAESLAAGGAANQSGNVDKFKLGRDDFCRFCEACRNLDPLVRHGDPPDIRFDGAERVIRRFCRSGCGERIEQGRFADIRQSDNATTETHKPEPFL